MGNFKLNWKYCCTLIIGIILIGLSVNRAYTSRVEVQPEVIDRYPKYFSAYDHNGLLLGGLKIAFDPCNGEACVPDRITANLCPNPKICISRSRNFNYFVDYLDAIFFKQVTTKLGMVSNVAGAILAFLFTFFGLRAYRKDISDLRVILLSSAVLFLPQMLSMDNLLYRSGKILTAVYISWLFLLFSKAKELHTNKNIEPALLWKAIALFISATLILSDEMAVYITGMCFVFFTYRWLLGRYFASGSVSTGSIYLNAIKHTGSLILVYLFFRISIEPRLANYLNEIRIASGEKTYANFSDFFTLNFETFQASINGIFFNVVDSLSPANEFAGQPWFWSGIVIIFVGIVYSFLQFQWGSFVPNLGKVKVASAVLPLIIFIVGLKFSRVGYDIPNSAVVSSVLALLIVFCIYLLVQPELFFVESAVLALFWVVCIYLMGLRHPFVISPAGFKAFYYYIPTIYLFFLWFSIGVTRNALISSSVGTSILLGILFFNVGNYLYSNNPVRFFPQHLTSFILESAETHRTIDPNASAEKQAFYLPLRKFFQGLTISKTSCFYNECQTKRTSEYTVNHLEPNQMVSVPLKEINQGERFEIQIISQYQKYQSTDHLAIKLLNSGDDHCCLLNTTVAFQSEQIMLSDIASYTYTKPVLEMENKSSFPLNNITVQLTILSVK